MACKSFFERAEGWVHPIILCARVGGMRVQDELGSIS